MNGWPNVQPTSINQCNLERKMKITQNCLSRAQKYKLLEEALDQLQHQLRADMVTNRKIREMENQYLKLKKELGV